MDALDVADELRRNWPPGLEDEVAPLDWDDPEGPGPWTEAAGAFLLAVGVEAAERLARERTPLTASAEGLVAWEQTCGLILTEIAQSGDPDARRDQIISRLREVGPPTLELVRAVIQPLWRYLDPRDILLAEVDRDALRADWPAGHTRVWNGVQAFGGGSIARASWVVRDDPACSAAGAQLDLEFHDPVDLGALLPKLVGPDGTTVFWNYVGDGNRPVAEPGQLGTAIRLYARAGFAGKPIFGRWTLDLDTLIGVGVLGEARLFVEGFGRVGLTPWEGLGAAKFHWAPVLETARLNGEQPLLAPSLVRRAWPSALAAVARLTYATRRADVVFWPAGLLGVPPPVVGAIPDDDFAIPDACIPD